MTTHHYSEERTCLHCDATIVRERKVGLWVDLRSGDDGGTYDYCPVSLTHEHQPAA